jgi:hypothetical protein
MLLSGWNWEDARAVWREEGREEGREEVLALMAAGCGIEEIQARLMVERGERGGVLRDETS